MPVTVTGASALVSASASAALWTLLLAEIGALLWAQPDTDTASISAPKGSKADSDADDVTSGVTSMPSAQSGAVHVDSVVFVES